MKFGRRHIKHIPNLGKEFTLINNNNKITTTVKFEIKSRGTAERILLLPINSDPDSSSNCLLLVGAIYRKKGFHQPSDLASFNKLKEEIEINIPETPSEKKSPGLSNHAVK